MANQRLHMPFNFSRITENNAWLLGFIFAESTIGIHLGWMVVKIYNKDKFLLERIKEIYNIPYKVVTQKMSDNTVYLIRISDIDFVKSLEKLGFAPDKSKLRIPKMTNESEIAFISGFLMGKGSFFKEKTGTYGFKVVFRSKVFIKDLSKRISFYSTSKVANPYCRQIVNEESCQIKYVTQESDLVTSYFGIEKFNSEF